MSSKSTKVTRRWESTKLKRQNQMGAKCHYDLCHSCQHTFYPKRLTKKQLNSRSVCPCICHWGTDSSSGITYQEALKILTKGNSGLDE